MLVKNVVDNFPNLTSCIAVAMKELEKHKEIHLKPLSEFKPNKINEESKNDENILDKIKSG